MTTSDPLVGATLDRRYFVESRIAGGGMATVYVAHDLRLDRRQALKVMHPSLAQDPAFVQRFINEAHAVARLSHPNVVQVFDQGEDSGHVFLAMEYVPGRTLRDLLKEQGRLGPQAALNVMASVLAALGAAHQAGMVHRDVKPENVLITEDGRAKVADFGLARAVEQSNQGLTRTGTLMGTAAYLAPEQIEKGQADARSDVYAAGIMLYELLTGGQPHTGETPIAIAYQHVNEDVPRPSNFIPDLPPEVDSLVTKATERDPRYRPINAGQFLGKVLDVLKHLPDDPHRSGRLAPVVPQNGAVSTVTAPQLIAGGAGAAVESPTLAVDMETAGAEGTDEQGEGRSSWFRRNRMLVLGGSAAVVALLVLGWWLLIGRLEPVPDVAGADEETARSQIEAAGLDFDLADEQDYSDDAEPGTVARTDPGIGTRLADGEQVTVFLSKGPQTFEMPDLAGEDVSDATEELEERGFATEDILQEETEDDSAPPGEVLSTEPVEGDTADREETVTLIISSGIDVPAVAGREVEEAVAVIEELGLEAETEEQASEDVPANMVISQSPDTGTSLGAGGTVTLTVSTGPPHVNVPDVVGMDIEEAVEELEDAGFEVEVDRVLRGDTIARQSVTDSAPEGTTIELIATPGGLDLGELEDRDDDDDDDGDDDRDDRGNRDDWDWGDWENWDDRHHEDN